MPMGMADIAEVLWNDYLRFAPTEPHWLNRDRFVLSNGHGSMLLYAVAYLTGYALDIDEIKHFRKLGSRCAGHPEREVEIGIETTTGPLGQGIANAVGMALAERFLATHFNRADAAIVDHYTYFFCGDGCLMEGVSHEACAFAGTQRLGKLIGFYDDNGISIDGEVKGWFTDDTPKRFEAYGWHVVPHVDGHDADAIRAAIEAARAENGPPVSDLLQDRDRLRRAQQAGHRGDARRRARRDRGRGRAQDARLGVSAVRDSGRHQARVGRSRARQEARGRLAEAILGLLAPLPRSRGGVHAAA
jgi:transketolase